MSTELKKNSQSWKNLEHALGLECRAYCEYTFYSQQAAKDGYTQISEIFAETADNELRHAKLLFKKMHDDAIPHTLDNLEAARHDEEVEGVETYQKAAQDARDEGLDDLGEWFDMLADIELHHKERFETLIGRINADEVFHREEPKVWYCTVCGHIHVGTEPPECCPVCDHPRGHFEIKAENY
ncbi:rubrerythrin family protein [Xiamenia xianingshaonis]|uniref:Rubrerythrin family protein n=1 Tax=Xiamenia xianingshaonis TaxID=2682776 RepID=A0A9E6MR40_9ACTN|nr:rubrerythrin family protein [Xiamenia xianingshaonis]NGM17677.1 rubrerythrin family protein [Eggerthellaceae bacterium zg-893]NHM13902.1 rubrerythrin family protein [Xiamenia xianingshaonis]QTU84409.1 rubrerythrin family protein [Xiamenia xianingshaonis]